jgi:hypothetical protein
MTTSSLICLISLLSPSRISWPALNAGTSMPWPNSSLAASRESTSSYSAKPNLHFLSSASLALVQRRSLPAHRKIFSIASSSGASSPMPPTKIVRATSSLVGGWIASMLSRICARSRSRFLLPPSAPKPARLLFPTGSALPPLPSRAPRSRSRSDTGGPAFWSMPSLITGALKLTPGMLNCA